MANAVITNYWGNAILEAYLRNGGLKWISLHSDDPGMTGANEISGGEYIRAQTTWAAVSNKTTANASKLTFSSLLPGNIRYYGIWDQQVGGNFCMSIPFDVSGQPANVALEDGDTWEVPANEIAITL